MIGGACLRAAAAAGHTTKGTYRKFPLEALAPLELASDEAVARLLDSFAPEAVICCAGWSWVDGCESDPARAFLENSDEPARLARLTHAGGGRFVYFSSSYIFDGRAGPYPEDAAPAPLSVYGRAKVAGESAIMEATGGRGIIVRTMGVYGEEAQRKNFVYQVRTRLSAGQRLRVPDDQFGNATFTGDIAEGVLRLLARGRSGVWNLAGPDPELNRADFARHIAREYQLDESLLEFLPTRQLGQVAPRPRQGGLVIRRMRDELGLEPRAWVRVP